jgi:Ca2+/Na+ antiporter
VSALITPLNYGTGFVFDGIVAVMTGVALWLFVMRGRTLRRNAGVIMLVMYVVYFLMII